MSHGSSAEAESVAAIRRAVELGVTFLDTAEDYGRGENAKVAGRSPPDVRHQVVIANHVRINP